MKACFQIAECSLSSAKIVIYFGLSHFYSYFLWKISRQMAPANAIGTPIRAGKLYPNPIATGIPPRKAPTEGTEKGTQF